ncbi:MAG: FtsK/SpoIIIE domain-containing protein, partial [Ilumatobacteraceae bacterium]
MTVAARSPDDLLGELADALGLDPRRRLRLDGRLVGRHETLRRAGVVNGSCLETVAGTAATPPDPAETNDPLVVVTVDAGPSSGRVVPLGAGRHVIGRSTAAAVSLADPALEPHHGLLDVGADGSARFVQLTGRVAARIDGDPVGELVGAPFGEAGAPVADGELVAVGTSRLRLVSIDRASAERAPAALTVDPADPWRRTLHRTPRLLPRWDPAPIAIPSSSTPTRLPSGLGMTAAVCTLLGAVLIAVLLRSPMFLLLGAVGVLAAGGMWVASKVGAFRDGRRAGAVRQRELATFAVTVADQRTARWHHHLASTPTVADALQAATHLRASVWARRPHHPDAFRVTLGHGPVAWEVAVDEATATSQATATFQAMDGQPTAPEVLAVVAAAERFDDAPVPCQLGPGSAIAVTGSGASGVVRSLVVQLGIWLGPADWRLLAVVDDPVTWDWCRWLPHGPGCAAVIVSGDDQAAQTAALAALDDGDDRHVLVVTDRPELLAQRTGPLRRFVGAATSVAIAVQVPTGEAVPALCRSLFDIGSLGVGRWWADASMPSRWVPVHAAGVTAAEADRAGRALAGLRDPEDPALAFDALATSVTLGALLEHHGGGPIDDAIAIAAKWRAGGLDPPPTVALGLTSDGVVEVDLDRDGPHVLVAGTTGSGKSELLRTLVVSLAARCSPDHVTFVLVDYKGGSTFDACAELPHTVGVVTDLDDRLAERALSSLEAELRRRERQLRTVGAADLATYRIDPTRPALPRLVVVIDEFAALAAELPTFLSSLVGVAQRGRSLGVHLVLATQRPSGVVDDDIRANTNLRLALRLHDPADARDVVGDDAPARFSRGTPGRAMLRLGPTEHVVFQSARCTGPARLGHDERLHLLAAPAADAQGATTELAVLVRSIRNAAALSDVAAPHRPWLPPLPERLGTAPPGALGLVDVPAAQRRDDLAWSPADGNLAIVGSFGSGTTTAVLAVVASVLRSDGGEHVYVIDARGDERLDALATAARCGGVVRPHEAERLGRLLDRLEGALDGRRSTAGRGAAQGIVLAVDGVPALRAALDGPVDAARWDQLRRIVGEGGPVGLTCVLTAERPTAMPETLLAACAERWVMHLDDPTDAAACGIRPAAVPKAVAGRLVVATTGCEAQLAPPPCDLDVGTGGDSAPTIGVLPALVDATAMPAGAATANGDLDLIVGVDHRTLGMARLTVPDGEHVLVAGPARSGRTTALVRLADSWSEATGGGRVLVVAGRGAANLTRRLAADDVVELAAADVVELVATVGAVGCRPVLVLIDDAEHVDHPTLAGLVAQHR